jgi:glycosyltransferase involved in cell wall biosynthesis
VAATSDCLINISGMLTDPPLTESIPVRVYLDLDPGFNQLWSAAEGIDVGFGGHTHFVTIGPALGDAGCDIPTCGHSWIATRQPVVLSEWPRAERLTYDAFSTVANWRGYGSITYNSVFYGQKAHAWRGLVSLPDKTPEPIVVALAIHPDEQRDLALLAAHGWTLIDPAQVTATPEGYRAFVQGSKGEIGVAKSGYVASRCGWFSDRSACYLASGRPVVAQETGFSRFLPTGEGLFAFETADDASAAIAAIVGDYERHSRAARAIAEEYFDASRVLPQLLERVGVHG